MKLKSGVVFLFLFCSIISYAQPRWSPEVRAKRESQWMQDSLRLNPEQVNKITTINLDFQRNMDKAANTPEKNKTQKQLMRKKNEAMKAILNKEQYPKYLKREKQIRKQEQIQYKGPHRPL